MTHGPSEDGPGRIETGISRASPLPVLAWTAGLVLFCVALVTCDKFISSFLATPLKRDEVEFLHSTWLIHQGARPFTDFFQHHSPLYLELVVRFARDSIKLDWVIALRIFSVLLAGASACLVAILSGFISAGSYTLRPWVAGMSAIIFLLVAMQFPVFEIRPEAVAVPVFLAAWIAFEIAARNSSQIGAATFGLLAGLAIAITPRAAWPVASLFLAGVIFAIRDRDKHCLSRLFLAGMVCTVTLSCLLLAVASPSDLIDWVYRFSRYSRPASPLLDTISAATLAWLLLPLVPVLLLAFAGRDLNARQRHSLLIPIGLLLAALLGMSLEPRQFGQSLSFIIVAVTVFYARCLGHFFLRINSGSRPSPFPILIVAAAYAIALSWQLNLLSIYVPHDLTSASDAKLVAAMRPDSELHTALYARSTFCKRHIGHSVLVEPTEFHPICLSDASYYWRGSEYLRAGTLEAAGIAAPHYRPLADAERSHPILIGPAFRKTAVPGEREKIDRFLDSEYHRSGWAYLRNDNAAVIQP
ncbi:MAG: hypothetical protein WAO76_17685 [Georgfuchsia sp.]